MENGNNKMVKMLAHDKRVLKKLSFNDIKKLNIVDIALKVLNLDTEEELQLYLNLTL